MGGRKRGLRRPVGSDFLPGAASEHTVFPPARPVQPEWFFSLHGRGCGGDTNALHGIQVLSVRFADRRVAGAGSWSCACCASGLRATCKRQ